MKYQLNTAKIDLGTTPIENIFLNNYLAIADGNAIKLYLYAYKQAYEGNIEDESFSEIGEKLGMGEDQVADSFGFWQEQGIVDIVKDGDSFSCNFKSLRELFLGISLPDTSNTKAKERKAGEGKDQAQVLSNDEDKSMTNKQMFDHIEDIIGTNLLPNEIERIHGLKDEFGQDRDLIVHGFEYCSEKQGKKNVNYVLTVLRNWAIDGINTMEDLAVHNKEKQEASTSKSKKKKRIKTKDRKSSDEIQEALNRKLIEDYKKAQGGSSD